MASPIASLKREWLLKTGQDEAVSQTRRGFPVLPRLNFSCFHASYFLVPQFTPPYQQSLNTPWNSGAEVLQHTVISSNTLLLIIQRPLSLSILNLDFVGFFSSSGAAHISLSASCPYAALLRRCYHLSTIHPSSSAVCAPFPGAANFICR